VFDDTSDHVLFPEERAKAIPVEMYDKIFSARHMFVHRIDFLRNKMLAINASGCIVLFHEIGWVKKEE